MRMATNFVSDGNDTSRSVSEINTFDGKIEGKEDDL